MSWIAVGGTAATVGGGLISQALSGDQESPQHRAQRIYGNMLYNPHGIMQALSRNRQGAARTYGSIVDLYRQNLQGARGLGKAGMQGIKNWRDDTNASGDQSLINRGLYNSTVTDSQHRQTGAQAQQMKQGVREDVARYTAGQRVGLAGALEGRQNALQGMRNQGYQLQLNLPTMGLDNAGSYQLGQNQQNSQFGSNLGGLLMRLMSGNGGFGGSAAPAAGGYGGNYASIFNPANSPY